MYEIPVWEVTQWFLKPESLSSWFLLEASCRGCDTTPSAATTDHNRLRWVGGSKFLPTVFRKQGNGQQCRKCAKCAHRYTPTYRWEWVPNCIWGKRFLLRPLVSSFSNRKTGLRWQIHQRGVKWPTKSGCLFLNSSWQEWLQKAENQRIVGDLPTHILWRRRIKFLLPASFALCKQLWGTQPAW